MICPIILSMTTAAISHAMLTRNPIESGLITNKDVSKELLLGASQCLQENCAWWINPTSILQKRGCGIVMKKEE